MHEVKTVNVILRLKEKKENFPQILLRLRPKVLDLTQT